MGSARETNPSLWITSAPPEREFGALDGEVTVDVAVVGGGITGIITAVLLKQAGVSVALVEAGRLSAGTTGYTTAKISALHGLTYAGLVATHGEETARAYASANVNGLATIVSLAAVHGIDCDLERRPAFTYTTDPDRTGDIEAEVEAAQRAGLSATFTIDTELPFPVAAVCLDDQAQFHPRRFCLALASTLPGGGSHVFERSQVIDVDDATPATVTTEAGAIRARTVVLATHLPFLDRGLFFAKCWPERSYAIAVRPGPDTPNLSGMYLSADQPTRSLRAAAEGVLIVGGEGHKAGQDPDTRRRYAALEVWAGSQLGAGEVTHRWSAHDHRSVDGLPFVGRLVPGSNVLVATGFGKWGMTNGAAAARILTDLVTAADNPWANVFDATRMGSVITSSELYKVNADAVGRRLVGDRLATLRVPDADSLAPGEGGIVRLDGDKVAAFRDDDGTLHALSPVCTHVGCLVGFNRAERTWDCPCHGSRFTLAGEVLEGPALAPLQRRRGSASTP
jgi:glycine/D-amino acid oxidase-like deaminating enzyme/nitrite reductase/ring-hydroxylating ferredoxin subunit